MKIIICEDQQILLDGLTVSLSKEPDFKIVGSISNSLDILPSIRSTKADLLLTDIITKDKNNALDIIQDVLKEFPNLKIVAITGFPDITFMEKAKKVGVNSFVYKNISTEELISVIKNTYSGYSVFPNTDKTKNMILSTLTDTESVILRLYCSGKDRDDIAKELFMSQSSVKAHISSILQKTGFSSMARVAIYAVSTGLIFTK
ncbi:MAG: response regulator transcription factor [Clostridia bacterium]|nr:response regulator transcription factor [Clostridia bacterium]